MMIQASITNRLKQLALGGAVAALLAVGAGGGAQVAGDPSLWRTPALAPVESEYQAFNFTKIEDKNSAKGNLQNLHVSFVKIEY